MLRKKEFWRPVAIWFGLGFAGFLLTGFLLFALATNRGLNPPSRSSFFWIGPALPDLFVEAFGVAALIWTLKFGKRTRILIGALLGMFSPAILFVVLLVLKSIIGVAAVDDLAWILMIGFWSMMLSGLVGGAYAAYSYSKMSSVGASSMPRHSSSTQP